MFGSISSIHRNLSPNEGVANVLSNISFDENCAAHAPSIAAGLGGVSRQFGVFRKMWHFNLKSTTAFVS